MAGAGLDNDGGMQVVSPDLVCPDSELGSGDVANSGLHTGVKAHFPEPEIERVGDENAGSDGVISGVSGERAEEGPRADPVAEQNVVVGERRQDRPGDRTQIQPSNAEKKRLRWEMARREMERRRAARQKERDPGVAERLGGVDSVFPEIGAEACEHGNMLRAP